MVTIKNIDDFEFSIIKDFIGENLAAFKQKLIDYEIDPEDFESRLFMDS